jgi:predicted restriction endonuclease
MNITDTQSETFDEGVDDLGLSNLLGQSNSYKAILVEYCLLALKPSLTEVEQDRMAEILEMGIEDSVLSFWLEEGDHLVAHHLGLIDEGFIKSQQDQFRRSMGQNRVGNLWRDLQSSTKVLQAYLHRQGFYQGSIDGIMGPSTQEALHKLLEKQPNDLTALGFT